MQLDPSKDWVRWVCAKCGTENVKRKKVVETSKVKYVSPEESSKLLSDAQKKKHVQISSSSITQHPLKTPKERLSASEPRLPIINTGKKVSKRYHFDSYYTLEQSGGDSFSRDSSSSFTNERFGFLKNVD